MTITGPGLPAASSPPLPDVTLLVTLHAEGPLLARTLRSLEEAAVYARRFGIRVELVAVLDRADAATRAALATVDAAAFDGGCTTCTVDNGSLGPSRNDGVRAARGRYVAMCDGDDLVSFNTIAEMVRLADASPPGALIFPEYLMAFGAQYHLARYLPLRRATPLAFLAGHPYISRVFAAREVFQALPYADVRLSPGYAFEDWHFNAEAVARGHDILVAEDTVLFYRQRPGSLLARANQLSIRQIPPCTLFEPATFRRLGEDAYRRTGRAPDPAPLAFGPTPATLDRPVLRHLVRAANAIDPAVDIGRLREGPCFPSVDRGMIGVGRAYYEIAALVEDEGPFDEVFLLPWAGTGGGETFLRDVMAALARVRPDRRQLVILGEQSAEGPQPAATPEGTVVVDLGGRWPSLDLAHRRHITLRLLESRAPHARLHIRDSAFGTGFFGEYWPVLGHHPAVFYRFSDAVVRDAGELFTRATGFHFVSAHAERLSLVVSDTERLVAADRARIGVWPERFQCLPSRRPPLVAEADLDRRAAPTTGRVLWASRLDWEKRPELLPHIARRLAADAPGATIDAFGRAVLGHADPSMFDGPPNLRYRGAFAGFDQLPHGDYDVFLYTSWFDGLPNVLLEAAGAGLPIVAPDTGGIRELVRDGETGVLLPLVADDGEAAATYAAAVARLLGDGALRRRLARAAWQRVAARHGGEAYDTRVRELFFPGEHGA